MLICCIQYCTRQKKIQSLPETGFQLFQKYAEQIRKWGWIISSGSNSSESFKKNMNILRRQTRLVTLVAVRNTLASAVPFNLFGINAAMYMFSFNMLNVVYRFVFFFIICFFKHVGHRTLYKLFDICNCTQ